MELLFDIILLLTRDDKRGRYYYLLCAEGTSHFLLALMDFLSRTVTHLRQDLSAVRLIDLIIGGLSVVPLLCFTLWFLFTAQDELLHAIPTRLRKLAKYILMSCIPLIAASNATGAFVGISYGTLGDAIAVGFIDERAQMLWSSFNELSLSLLAVFEAMAFLLLLARLTKVIRHRKRIELMSGTGDIHHFRGIIIMNLGMVLSLAETLVGFVPQSFALAIARRGTKSAGRILIILGLLKGWDHVEDVRFVLQEPPKPNRFSKMSFRQLFPSILFPSDDAQISGRTHERVTVRQLRGRAPTLHLRLSEFDVSPIMKTFRAPSRSPNSIQIHLIPQTPTTGSLVDTAPTGYLDVQGPYHRDTPLDVPTSPLSPNSPWMTAGSTPRVSFFDNSTPGPRPSASAWDEYTPQQTHTRGNTMSSTLSHLPAEVMTLSESPPDPGFVLPIPSRSRTRQNFDFSLDDPMLTSSWTYSSRAVEPKNTGESSSGRRPPQPSQEIPSRHVSPSDEDLALQPLEPPRPRRFSWVSESSDASSAVISTATRLRRANTIISVTPPTTSPNRTVVSNNEGRTRQRIAATNEHPLSNVPSTVRVGRLEGDTV